MTIFSNLALLRNFVSIAESGSISAAARNLGLTQPTLSRQLAQIEAECGTALLRRDTHRMHLTDMKLSHGKVNPAEVSRLLLEELKKR